jgi:metallo-beta-lactamase class B
VGSNNDSVWAVTTSQGIILLNAAQDYAAEAEVVEGMMAMGLNPADVKYVVATAPNPQNYGGARLFQDRYGARVLCPNRTGL